MKDIDLIILRFNSEREVSLEEARSLYVKVMSGLLERINSDEQIRPYLSNFPFTEKNSEIMIAFVDHSNCPVGSGKIALINGFQDTICYHSYDPITDSFQRVYKETYDEAQNHNQ